jgi:hypothetical protein
MRSDWGERRTCKKCHNPFYDMHKDPMSCPKCGTDHKTKDFEKKPQHSLNNDIPDNEEDLKRTTHLTLIKNPLFDDPEALAKVTDTNTTETTIFDSADGLDAQSIRLFVS